MGFDVRRPRRSLLAISLVITAFFASCLVIAAPAAAAAGTADLSVSLTNKTAKPGKRVTYTVTVTNHGPSKAEKVQIDFFTSRALSSVRWSNPTGRCIRSSTETACLFGTLKAGQSSKAMISGVISKKLTKGTMVNNHVTLASNTHLTNTANDVATDNYRIGIPNVIAPLLPSPTPSGPTKLDKITNAASDAINVTNTALIWSIVALAAAAAWFGVGLTMRARKRRNSPTPDLD